MVVPLHLCTMAHAYGGTKRHHQARGQPIDIAVSIRLVIDERTQLTTTTLREHNVIYGEVSANLYVTQDLDP